MPTYTVHAEVTISIYTVVEAESLAEAKEIAEGRDMQSFCHQCAGGMNQEGEVWTICGELDGEACDLQVEEKEKNAHR